MSELPTGTVSLLFSDVEGSTVLLSRLGAAYAEALDGQRQVLRKAWAEHGGVELGTEGDSFYVVFSTAPAAVAAAAQAQRELAVFEWPAGERVRVRMGIHTGNPTVHDGAYVGMDVHRAARIAGSAHGGQVVVSQATAHLVDACLPNGVELHDLGSHQLKDIPQVEHLFQLAIDGLPSEFPPIKTLGAASSLPRPATPLVGRDGELAELTALMGSPEVRLVTLTGPGGSGKTRLAIALAGRLRERFLDGVYFVPLADVTTPDVMWTSIAEVLDVPPEGRIPPGFFVHVAHRSALFVLDNLEQIPGCDDVVAELLEHAPQAVVIVTSRRPLNVPGEIQHAVPPLELPEAATLTNAERSGAVQMFVQHAKAVKGSFTLTASNAADVVKLCQRLDGLPLALELAAARSKLLSPAALLARLDKALDLAAAGSRGSSRQKTLRDTIAWSYDLLAPTQQAFFRRMGVFAGGADLDAISAVSGDILGESDPLDLLDLIADLVDASLVTITEGDNGEPRVWMLQTIHAFALDRLAASREEEEQARRLHAEHFLAVAEQLHERRRGEYLQARRHGEIELDNFRVALEWALNRNIEDPQRTEIALKILWLMRWVFGDGGYLLERRRWLERGLSAAGDSTSTERVHTMVGLVQAMLAQGDIDEADRLIHEAIAVSRELDDRTLLPIVLNALADTQLALEKPTEAQKSLEESLRYEECLNDRWGYGITLGNLAAVEYFLEHADSAEELFRRSIVVKNQSGDLFGVTVDRHNLAYLLATEGRLEEARALARDVVPTIVSLRDPQFTAEAAETCAEILVRMGGAETAARLLGGAAALRDRNATVPTGYVEDGILDAISKGKASIGEEAWHEHYRAGSQESVEELLIRFCDQPR